MCMPNTCEKCNKKSFIGCSQHLKILFKDIKKIDKNKKKERRFFFLLSYFL